MNDFRRHDRGAQIRRMLVNDLFVELAEEKIGLDDGLQTVVGLDSIGFSELRILCERKFDVQISDDDYAPRTSARSTHRQPRRPPPAARAA